MWTKALTLPDVQRLMFLNKIFSRKCCDLNTCVFSGDLKRRTYLKLCTSVGRNTVHQLPPPITTEEAEKREFHIQEIVESKSFFC